MKYDYDEGSDASDDSGSDACVDINDTTHDMDVVDDDTAYAADLHEVDVDQEMDTTEPISSYDLNRCSEDEKAQIGQFMADHPEMYRAADDDNQTDSSLNEDGDEAYFHNKDSGTLTLGKFEQDEDGNELPSSYRNVAKNDGSAYFDNPDYGIIQWEGRLSDAEMYEASGNKDVVEKALKDGKDIQFSHDPRRAEGGLAREWNTLERKTGCTVEDVSEGEGKWHFIGEGSGEDEDEDEHPLYDPKDYD